MEYANHLKEYAPAWSASQVDEEVARIRKAAEARKIIVSRGINIPSTLG